MIKRASSFNDFLSVFANECVDLADELVRLPRLTISTPAHLEVEVSFVPCLVRLRRWIILSPLTLPRTRRVYLKYKAVPPLS
jgi:hypothetical protein